MKMDINNVLDVIEFTFQYNKGKLWKDIKDKYVDDLAFTG